MSGDNYDQRELARMGGAPYAVYVNGMGWQQLAKAAEAAGYRATMMELPADTALKVLRGHTVRGGTAVVYVPDEDHWVAALDIDCKGRFLIDDPYDKDEVFFRMSNQDLRDYTADDDGRISALVVHNCRRWHLTEEFIDMCEEGARMSAVDLANLLLDIASDSMTARKSDGGRALDICAFMRKRRKAILARARRLARAVDVEENYRELLVVAGAVGLHKSSVVDGQPAVNRLAEAVIT
jgi:hypothetical protein